MHESRIDMYSSGEAHSRFPDVLPHPKMYLLIAFLLQSLHLRDDAYDGDDVEDDDGGIYFVD